MKAARQREDYLRKLSTADEKYGAARDAYQLAETRFQLAQLVSRLRAYAGLSMFSWYV